MEQGTTRRQAVRQAAKTGSRTSNKVCKQTAKLKGNVSCSMWVSRELYYNMLKPSQVQVQVQVLGS